MIELRNIYKFIDGHKILDNLSLKFNEREMVCLIGPMGGGKSTLLRCIAGLVEPDAGEVVYTSGQQPRIGMVFQHFNLFPHLDVLRNLTLAPVHVLGMEVAEAERIALEQLEMVGLAHRSRLFPEDLSAGQQQRVAIARCMMMNPSIVLLDEPMSALDPLAAAEVMDVLRRLKKEMMLIMVTHKLDAVAELADRVVFLDKGRVCEDGTPEEILRNPREEETRLYMSHIKDLHYVIESPKFDRPELNARIEQYCDRFGLGIQAAHFVQLAVEESLNLIPLDKGVRLLLSKVEREVRMSIEISVEDTGVSFIDESSCKDDLSLSLLQGLCDVLDEKVEDGQRVMHLELNQDRLLLK